MVLLGQHALAISFIVGVQSQLSGLQEGTIDVPIPRVGDCNQVGPATYVYRMSKATPNDYFPDSCKGLCNGGACGATVHFNDPCAWAHGQAQLTVAHFTNMCKGATRTIHWHNGADEWGFVVKGRLETFVASPDGLPWPSSNNVLGANGVWYFPSGWLHGLLCHTPEEEGGCEFTIVFASPQAAEPNGHNLDTTLAQAPDEIAAAALGVSVDTYARYRPNFARAAHSIHYSNKNMTAPIVTMVAPGACDPECPRVSETTAAPAGMEAKSAEITMRLPNTPGVVLHQIRQEQFAFARTMSQERTELEPGAARPMVWASADAILVVIKGTIVYSLEGGIPGSESKSLFPNETLRAGDVAYLPNARAYWFREASGKEPAMTITVFNVGNWKNFEMGTSLSEMNSIATMSNLHLTHVKNLDRTIQLSEGCPRGSGQCGSTAFREYAKTDSAFGNIAWMLISGLAAWSLFLTVAVVYLLRKVQAQTCTPVVSPLLA